MHIIHIQTERWLHLPTALISSPGFLSSASYLMEVFSQDKLLEVSWGGG